MCSKESISPQKSLSSDHNQYSKDNTHGPATTRAPNSTEFISQFKDEKLHIGRKVATFLLKWRSAEE